MADLPEDKKIYPLMLELQACLCDAIGVEPCFCGIVVGSEIPMDFDGCENCLSAYVRLDSANPSTEQFPQPDQRAQCGTLWAFTLAVGIARCAPVFGDDLGNAPTEADINAFSATLLADMSAIVRAISCCFAEKFEDANYVLGPYTPFPPAGGVGGGEITLIVQELF